MNSNEAALYLRVKPRTLVLWRHRGEGPAYRKVGGRIVYVEQALRAFIQTRARAALTRVLKPGPVRLSAFEHAQIRDALAGTIETMAMISAGNVAHKRAIVRDFALEAMACLDTANARRATRLAKGR